MCATLSSRMRKPVLPVVGQDGEEDLPEENDSRPHGPCAGDGEDADHLVEGGGLPIAARLLSLAAERELKVAVLQEAEGAALQSLKQAAPQRKNFKFVSEISCIDNSPVVY